MQLTLSATGIDTGASLFSLTVDGDGHWVYESRWAEGFEGDLPLGDVVQLKSLYDRVQWDLETVNAPVGATDRTLFRLAVADGHGHHAVYESSEAMNHRSFEFRDLIHFLRHNVVREPQFPPPPPFPEGPEVRPYA